VFCRLDVREKVPVLSIPVIQYIVSFAGVAAVVPDESIEAVRRVVAAGGVPLQYVSAGDRVQISSGCLAGLTGVVTREAGKDRFVVSIDLLQRSVGVEIDRDSIRPLEESTTSSHPFVTQTPLHTEIRG
jgi:transcription antitermination factor NusG